MQNLLFITWDGPQTSYMEGLFMPIFQEISKSEEINFHVMQFTWANEDKINVIKEAALSMGITYSVFPILRKPIPIIGSLFTLFTGSKKIRNYIEQHRIDFVMARSTFPAFMVNRLKEKNFKYIFDADGLPIEEQVDFTGLKKDGFHYKWLKKIEKKSLSDVNLVLTRSKKSIDFHLGNIGNKFENKFAVVYNGRDASVFEIDEAKRKIVREKLGIAENEILLIYCGSLGSQYGFSEMLQTFHKLMEEKAVKFLILTGNTAYALKQIGDNSENIIVKNVAFVEIASYLNAADAAFAFRIPSFSMQGVAPIKLGEYLLSGLAVIASKGIGDTEEILQNFKHCFLYDHNIGLRSQMPRIIDFIKNIRLEDRRETRDQALQYFSLQSAAKSYICAFKKMNM